MSLVFAGNAKTDKGDLNATFSGIESVDPKEKLTTTWGDLKEQHKNITEVYMKLLTILTLTIFIAVFAVSCFSLAEEYRVRGGKADDFTDSKGPCVAGCATN